MEPAAVRLKQLREAARPSISIRQMAEKLDLDHSTYVRYERPERYKKRFLPVELTRRVASILVDHGVEYDAVLSLGGISADESIRELSAQQAIWLELYDDLSTEQRTLLVQLARQMIAPRPTDDTPGTVHTPALPYLAQASRA